MRWNQVINNFIIQRKAMAQKTKDDVPDVPIIRKVTMVALWADSMRVFLSKVPSARGIATMAYVTRKEEKLPIVAPALPQDQTHLLEHGLVEDEYENLLHSDVRFQNDNGTLFGYLEEATCGNTFAFTIKTYECTCNGRAACLALNMQHAGERKQRKQLKLIWLTSQAQNGMAALILH